MIKLKKTNFCCLRVKKVSLLVTASLLMVGPFTTANSKVIEPSLDTYRSEEHTSELQSHA